MLLDTAMDKIRALFRPGDGLVYSKRIATKHETRVVVRAINVLDEKVCAIADDLAKLYNVAGESVQDKLTVRMLQNVQVTLLLLDGDDQRWADGEHVFAVGLFYYIGGQPRNTSELKLVTLGFRFYRPRMKGSGLTFDTVTLDRFDEIDNRIGWNGSIIGKTECDVVECSVCGAAECPFGNPLHNHLDGCPSCYLSNARVREGSQMPQHLKELLDRVTAASRRLTERDEQDRRSNT